MSSSLTLDSVIRSLEQTMNAVDTHPERVSTGTVLSLADNVARIEGLQGASYGELVTFE
jgi:F0F1-type ATP synthase alpha subunit